MVDVLSLLSAIGGLGGLAVIISVAFWLGKKFAQIDEGFKSIDKRFRLIDERFDQIDRRFKQIDERFESIEGKLKEHDTRFDRIETFLYRLTTAIKSINEFTIDILGYEGLLRRGAVDLVKREITRVLSFVSPNPLTKYEKQRLKELLEKDELNLKEAKELYEIANKVLEDYGDRIEAWKLLWYSRFWIAYN